jgi:SAM-dependent methyltransferase
VDYTCSRRPQLRQRSKIVPGASGVVLEIGFGSGLNLPYYDAKRVERVLALEPSDAMWALAAPRVEASPLPVERIPRPAEDPGLAAASVDSAVVTYTLCTIPEVATALAGLRRALRPGAPLLFCEHGAAPDPAVRRWQDRLDPIWGWLSGGCHINREIPRLLEAAGFRLHALETLYLPGWRPASFNVSGSATPG